MTQPSTLAAFAVSWNRLLDYCPGVSTVSSLVYLFQKYVSPSQTASAQAAPSQNTFSPRYSTFLAEKSVARSVTLLVPVLGNLVIALADLWNWRIKQNLISALRENKPLSFNGAPKWLKKDPEIQSLAIQAALGAIGKGENIFLQLDLSLKMNIEIAIAAAKNNNTISLRDCTDEMCSNKELVLLLVAKQENELSVASSALRQDEDVVLAAATKDRSALYYAHSTLRESNAFSLRALAVNKDVFIDSSLKDNPEFMLKALQRNSNCSVSDSLKKNLEFMTQALEISQDIFPHPSLYDDETFMLFSLGKRENFFNINDKLKNSSEFMLKAIAIDKKKNGDGDKCWQALHYTPVSLKKDLNFMLEALEMTSEAFERAGESVQKNEQFIRKALELYPKFKDNPSFMTAAIKVNPALASEATASVRASFAFKLALEFSGAAKK